MATRDPREIITPDAFTVAPELLGRPLATAWRRGVALTVDGLVVATLSAIGSFMLGIVAVVVLFRASAPSEEPGLIRRSVRFTLRAVAALILFTLVVEYAGVLIEGPSPEPTTIVDDRDVSDIDLSGLAAVAVGADLLRIHRAESEEEARVLARQLVDRLASGEVSAEQVDAFVESALAEAPASALEAARAVADSIHAREPLADALRAEVAAAAANASASAGPSADAGVVAATPDSTPTGEADGADTAVADAGDGRHAYAAPVADAQAAGVVASLAERVARLERENDRLERRNDRLRDAAEDGGGGLFALLRYFAEEIGIGMGWAGLYFTAFLALWRGQTPGKRLLGIRVLRLDAKPIGWWFAFERFGGYAAGIATGLLGFAQIFWDANRQGVHDKIAETVVVRERRREPVPGAGRSTGGDAALRHAETPEVR